MGKNKLISRKKQKVDFRVKMNVMRPTSLNSTITANGARIVDHDDKLRKSNHEVYAPTATDLSAVAPGLSGPKWRRTKARPTP